ncbi:hypothetical protein LU646_11590 [Pseudomonas alloputida]|uniref:hypothetical protein n=1 Tax=Pseudomonas alloputida TaxID=1940621 RepID=UPI001E5696C2|nr:hypothetical protein [Pseudomonas alloputida]MCE1058518.1 hypothetical protein [Pseudomonas alloputida]
MPEQNNDKDAAGHIRNPLTVISRFAALAEISGTAVLPFIEPENQATFIWFLMLFPALLVILFFLTLNYNHKTLYAPSDYKNQNHFLSLFGIASTDERQNKLEAELDEGIAEPTTEPTNPLDPEGPVLPEPKPDEPQSDDQDVDLGNSSKIPDGERVNPVNATNEPAQPLKSISLDSLKETRRKSLKRNLELIENTAILKLCRATKIQFDRHLKIESGNIDKPIIFDGLSISTNRINAAEVKLFDTEKFSINRLIPTLKEASRAAQIVQKSLGADFVFHLVIVLSENINGQHADSIASSIQRVSNAYGLTTNVYLIETANLLATKDDFTLYTRHDPLG